MQTMHLTLPVGAFDWQENPLSEIDFQERVGTLRAIMATKGWGGVLVFGEIHECGLLTYYSNYAARLSPALTLIPLEGDLRVLTLVGGRMVPAGKLTTWIEDVRPAGNLAESLGEWLAENASGGQMAIAGFDLMKAGDYASIADMDEIATAEDATDVLWQLIRTKSIQEVAMMRDNCAILDKVVTAVTKSQENNGSPASSAIVAEKTARNLGAQDARCLYSPDDGKTFLPFQKLSGDRSDPFILYVALKMRGYWADGFITIGIQNEAIKSALDEMIVVAKPGASSSDLAAVQNKYIIRAQSHPVLLGSLGSGIGVSLEEVPILTSGSPDTIKTEDIISLKLGIIEENGQAGFASALVHVQSSGNEILWKST
jgi:Xaa-Pro aminopeptidase